jgi:hypothetical protein
LVGERPALRSFRRHDRQGRFDCVVSCQWMSTHDGNG